MAHDLVLRRVTGPDVAPYLDDVARLRIAVFREYPYLYDGHLDYERRYLRTYSASPESLFVLALDGPSVVGCSTVVPLRHPHNHPVGGSERAARVSKRPAQ